MPDLSPKQVVALLEGAGLEYPVGPSRMLEAVHFVMSVTNPWRDAVWEQLASCSMDATTDESPRSILKRVIAWNVQAALDAAVSSDGQALIDEGAARDSTNGGVRATLPDEQIVKIAERCWPGVVFVTRGKVAPTLPWRRRAVLGVKRELESVASWRRRTMRVATATGARRGSND
jgi:hypothetical protein